jgi:hypothetical protein
MAAYLNPDDFLTSAPIGEGLLREAAASGLTVTVCFRPEMGLEPRFGEIHEHPTEPGEYVVDGFEFSAEDVEELISE